MSGDFELTIDEIRVVARYALYSDTQVGHILRAAASAAHAAELAAGGDDATADRLIEQARRRATPVLVDVLRRYPPAPRGRNRVGQLMATLDTSLRRDLPVLSDAGTPGDAETFGLVPDDLSDAPAFREPA